jgi:hypothetical protein
VGIYNLIKLFSKKEPDLFKENGESKTTGELMAEVTDGASLVGNKQTWEHAEEKKHDLEYMKKCCSAELSTMSYSTPHISDHGLR